MTKLFIRFDPDDLVGSIISTSSNRQLVGSGDFMLRIMYFKIVMCSVLMKSILMRLLCLV